jgi:D-sedoheptulose 7-phosphate isomerase
MGPEEVELARRRVDEAVEMHSALRASDVLEQVVAAADLIVASFGGGGKLLVMGNGGSSALAEHLAAEMLGRYMLERDPFPAVALAENASALTAISNDLGYDSSFSRQLSGLARPGDVALALTTSGRSPNVIAALRAARERDCRTVVMAGADPGEAGEAADIALCIPSTSTPRIQEGHELVGHILCELVEQAMSGPGGA